MLANPAIVGLFFLAPARRYVVTESGEVFMITRTQKKFTGGISPCQRTAAAEFSKAFPKVFELTVWAGGQAVTVQRSIPGRWWIVGREGSYTSVDDALDALSKATGEDLGPASARGSQETISR